MSSLAMIVAILIMGAIIGVGVFLFVIALKSMD
jgi:uncharacterized membrane protein